ncbi:MAG: tetratricopeptide repeat protein [Pirellulales bacterium]|nr:tetratricopeptide repeat protein [Pirellulales bacterium]
MEPEGQAKPTEATGRQPLSPAKRQRLQKLYTHAGQQASQKNFDYATDLFTQCVLGDLDNEMYLRSFLNNLYKKYDYNKKGAKMAGLKTRGTWAAMKKSQLQKDWEGVLKHGYEILKVNPWDSSALLAMSAAGEEMQLDKVPLMLILTAFNSSTKDVSVARACAKALTLRHEFQQAITCWHRVEVLKPKDEEAAKQIGELQVKITIDKGGYENAESSVDVAADKDSLAKHSVASEKTPTQTQSPYETLEREIRREPSSPQPYVQLAEAYFRDENYTKAEEVLTRAFEATDGNPDIREKLEDAQLRNLRIKIREAEKERAAVKDDDVKSAEARKKHHQLRKEFDLKSLEVWKNRVERYPNDLTFKYNLGDFCQRTGNYKEAIHNFQQARNDPRWKGLCLLKLGQCFSQIKQYRLAVAQLESAIAEIPDRDTDTKKEALYYAGRLALGLKDADMADRHLTALAAMDFSYKDVSDLLDKVAEMRNNE